jgi:alpha-galactosidase
MEKYVLIGAGSAMFTRGLLADMIRQGEPCELALVDIDPAALEVAERLAAKMVALSGAPVRLSAATDRRQVLPGATVVICTIGVGGRRAWEQDVLIPRKYGVYQPVGDSVMPGGTSRALRMIPAMVAIAQDVQALAPQALFFNYGNPMAPVCRAVRKATGANMVGLCHGVFGVARHLARALDVTVERLTYSAVGMNHLTWFVEVRLDGQDAMPRLRELAATRKNARAHEISSFADFAPLSWHLLELFGGFPAAMDRHVTEFFPQFVSAGRYYEHTLGVDAFSFEGTIAAGDRIFAEMKQTALSDEPLPADYFERIGGEHEQVLEIVRSIRGESGRVYSVNLPNRGQVPNLPAEAIVESPAVADGAGLRPIVQPPLPAGIVGTLATRLAWVETVVEAALEGSRRKFVQALVLDGAVSSLDVAERLADELLTVQAAHLPQF